MLETIKKPRTFIRRGFGRGDKVGMTYTRAISEARAGFLVVVVLVVVARIAGRRMRQFYRGVNGGGA